MKSSYKKLLQHASSRYVIVGGGVYLLELVIILIAQALGLSAVAAVGVSYGLGTLISFLLQKFFTFGDRRLQSHVVLPQLLATCTLVLCNFGFTLLVTKLLAPYVAAIVSRTIALAITTFWNFYLYKTRIFKSGIYFV